MRKIKRLSHNLSSKPQVISIVLIFADFPRCKQSFSEKLFHKVFVKLILKLLSLYLRFTLNLCNPLEDDIILYITVNIQVSFIHYTFINGYFVPLCSCFS